MCHILSYSAGHVLLRSLYEENTSYYSQKKEVKLKVPKKVTNFVDFLEYDRSCSKKAVLSVFVKGILQFPTGGRYVVR